MARILKSLLICLGFAAALSAAIIDYDAPPITSSGLNPCLNFDASCLTTAYFNATSLNSQNAGAISPLFQSAFNAWNASAGGGWKLDDGGNLSGNFDVVADEAQFFDGVANGGVTIQVGVGNLNLPTPGTHEELIWVQGLNIDYNINGVIVPSYYAMDTATLDKLNCSQSGISCPPAYPYQTGFFYDQPQVPYMAPGGTQAFFNANAYLAIENTSTDTLTVYDGISYGFANSVSTATPEPSAGLLFGSGLTVALLARRRRRSS